MVEGNLGKVKRMKNWIITSIAGLSLLCAVGVLAAEPSVSESTQECIECHTINHPGIVEDWHNSRHAVITPGQALKVKGLARKVSSSNVPESLQSNVVGCAECHTLRHEAHADTFEHNGYDIHVVVSPDDCQTCHQEERKQFADNVMAYAYKNFVDNKLYHQLERSISGTPILKDKKIHFEAPDETTRELTCLYCHGTKLEVVGTETRESDMGAMDFPIIKGWPNQGTGRINLDGSRGACTACHTRHTFSMAMARKPYTCKECHLGPDVPVFKVYSASKHGNIFATMQANWNFKTTPWVMGENFGAPTCAACHVSLLVNTEGDIVTRRTHRMNDRLAWRLFGLIYAHPHPQSPDTSIIRNQNGQPLPTTLNGEYATKYLIGKDEQKERRQTMQSICLNCHATSWVHSYFARHDHTIQRTNAHTITATRIMGRIWERNYASGLSQGANPFDEAIEKKWSSLWLFYANSIRFTSAMAGGGDYSVFGDGYYQFSTGVTELEEWLRLREQNVMGKPAP